MRLFQTGIFLFICILFGTAALAERDAAQNLTIITSPSFSERKAVEKRYRFLLPKFVQRCSDIPNDDMAADMLVTSHSVIKEAGLENEEGLLDFTNNLFSMTSQIYFHAQAAGVPVRCSRIWAMYVLVREEGLSQSDAMSQLPELVRSLY